MIHFVTPGPSRKLRFWKIFEEPVPHRYQLRALEGAALKFQGESFALSSAEVPSRIGRIPILPWESVV